MPRAHDGLLREIAIAIAEQRGERGSLVVVGAHHFGSDYNDPLYAAVANIAWSSVLLVEASPLIAATLRTRVRERNPTPRVPPARVIVVNEGVCPSSSPASELPFYTLDTRGLEGLPRWADQVRRAQVCTGLGVSLRQGHRCPTGQSLVAASSPMMDVSCWWCWGGGSHWTNLVVSDSYAYGNLSKS